MWGCSRRGLGLSGVALGSGSHLRGRERPYLYSSRLNFLVIARQVVAPDGIVGEIRREAAAFLERCEAVCCKPEDARECTCHDCRDNRSQLLGPEGYPVAYILSGTKCNCLDCKACGGPRRASVEKQVQSSESDDDDWDDDGSPRSDEIEDFGPEAYWGGGDSD